MREPRRIFRHALLSLCFVLLYLLLSRPEVIVLSELGFTAWYPATGLILALMLGVSPWYVFLACFADTLAGKLLYHQPLLSFTETLGAAGSSACYAVAAYVLRGPRKIDLGLRQRQDVMRYVSVTTLAAVAAALCGVFSLVADHTIPWSDFWRAASGWFLGDEVGILGIAPFLLIYVFPWVRRQLSSQPVDQSVPSDPVPQTTSRSLAILEAISQAIALVLLLRVMFGPELGPYELFYLSFVPIIWMAMRQGIRRVAIGLPLFNFGLVIAMHFFPPTPARLVKTGLLMFVVSALGLIVGSAVSERHRIAADLFERTAYLNSLIQNSPLGIVVLNREGRIELTNAAFGKLFQLEQTVLVGKYLHHVFPPGDATEAASQLPELLFSEKTQQRSVRRRRRDGNILDLELHTVPVLRNDEGRGAYTIYQDISEQARSAQAERKYAESLKALVAELEVHSWQMTMLNEMGRLLECCGTSGEASSVVGNCLQKLFPDAVSGILYMFRASRNTVETAAQWGAGNTSEPLFPPDACWALRRGQPHWSSSHGEGITCSHLSPPRDANCLCLPLVGQGETLGVLHLAWPDTPPIPSENDPDASRVSRQTLGTTVAAQIALSLANLRLRETLRDQSIRDPLTGLFNRRFMHESLERELQRARRKNHSLAILLLDLDHFKRFNDTFGHDAGDFVLRSLADTFRSFFRSDDIVCRHGGEEFAFLLPESSSADAVQRANALRMEVKRLRLEYADNLLGQITLSIGVVAFPDHGSSSEDLLKLADHCLYQSKAAGRDRVTVAVAPADSDAPRPSTPTDAH